MGFCPIIERKRHLGVIVRRFYTILGLFVLLSSLLVACSGGEESSAKPNTVAQPTNPPPVATVPPDAEPALPLDETGAQLVAVVNGTGITLVEFERAFSRSQPEVSDSASYDAAAGRVLNTLVEQILLDQQAAAMGITISAEEIEAQYQDTRAMISDDAEWQQWLDNNGFTEEEFRESLHNTLITQRVQQSVVNADQLVLTTVRARHILVDTSEGAAEILARLDAGEGFSQLAAVYSKDPNTKDTGGDLGWFVREDLTVPELADFALQLQPGQRGGPVETVLGFHVIETLAFGERPATPEEQYAASMQQFNAWLGNIWLAATIEQYMN
jgi:parvulin-like peptidyl-prolyl isomerase